MSATIPAATTAQIALRTGASVLLFLGGLALLSGFGLLKRRGRLRADPPSLPRIALGGVILLGGLMLKVALAPNAAMPDEIGPHRFSSATAPTLSLDAPAGWTLTHDAQAGRVAATGPGTSFMVETSRMSDGVHPDEFFRKLSEFMKTNGATDESRFEETVDGLRASGVLFKLAEATFASWYVPRGGPLVTNISCKAAGPTSAREACRAVLSTLRWRPPGPL